MKTAQDMIDYVVANNYLTVNSGITSRDKRVAIASKNSIKHFLVVADNLLPDESVLHAFRGATLVYDFDTRGDLPHSGGFAITDKNRIVLGIKKIFQKFFYTWELNAHTTIDKIDGGKGFFVSSNTTINLSTISGSLRMSIDKDYGNSIFQILNEFIASHKASLQKEQVTQDIASNFFTADELIKLKNLMDIGVLTTEEFNHNKSKLLGLVVEPLPQIPCLDEINKLQQLMYTGVISQAEYEQKRKQLIGL